MPHAEMGRDGRSLSRQRTSPTCRASSAPARPATPAPATSARSTNRSPSTCGGRMPMFTDPYVQGDAQRRRGSLLESMETEFAREHHADPFAAHRNSEARAWRLMRARQVFDTTREWPQGEGAVRRPPISARNLLPRAEAHRGGRPFVEIGPGELRQPRRQLPLPQGEHGSARSGLVGPPHGPERTRPAQRHAGRVDG